MCQMCGPNPALFWEKLGVFVCFFSDWRCAGGKDSRMSMSQLFLPVLMWIFSEFQYIGITQGISAFLSEGIFPCVTCDCSMYVTSPWEGGI